MRSAALALVAAMALGACNPSGNSGDAGTASGGGLFPNLTGASYRAEATITHTDGSSIPVVIMRDGAKLRMEMTTPQGLSTMVSDGSTGEGFVIATAQGRTIAMRLDSRMAEQFRDPAQDWSNGEAVNPTRVGPCSAAGESGSEWTDANNTENHRVCTTDDGIILRLTEGERTVWETTSVARGPQSADLFTLPPGVEVLDLGALGAQMEDALARAKAQAGQ